MVENSRPVRVVSGGLSEGDYSPTEAEDAARNKTQILKEKNVGGNQSNSAVYTVPVGKVFFLTSWTLSMDHGAADTQQCELTANIDSTRTSIAIIKESTPYTEVGSRNDRVMTMAYVMPIKFAAADVVEANTNTNVSVQVTIQGWLEDA